MADIVIDRIAKDFATFRALQEVSLAVADGEFIALLGPSGAPKGPRTSSSPFLFCCLRFDG